MNEKIDTEEIKNNLNGKINNSIDGKISSSQQKSIDTFVDTICKEYEKTILKVVEQCFEEEKLESTNLYMSITLTELIGEDPTLKCTPYP